MLMGTTMLDTKQVFYVATQDVEICMECAYICTLCLLQILGLLFIANIYAIMSLGGHCQGNIAVPYSVNYTLHLKKLQISV